jgi:pyruvate formate lyase activating enzyme
MRCAWCHNPETVAPYPELYWKRRLCTQCGKCLDACPRDAIEPPILPEEALDGESAYHKIIRSRCDRCLKCVEACLYQALEIVGRPMSAEEILAEALQDKPFYDNSGGGLTLSGGEPTAHADFTLRLLRRAREMGLHTCLDTSGFCEWEVLREIARSADIVLYDLKHLDPEQHRQKTGADNRLILGNLARLAETGREIWIRIPVIPDFNDSLEFHARAAAFLAALPGRVERVDLLPFHNWCQDKYGWLGVDWELREAESLDPIFLEIPAESYREKGLAVTIGGSGFEDARAGTG